MIMSPFKRLACFNRSGLGFIIYCLGKPLKPLNVPARLNTLTYTGASEISRLFSSKSTLEDNYVSYYEEEDSNYVLQKLSRKENIERFVENIGCTEAEAASMIREYPKLKLLHSDELLRKLQFYNEKGIPTQNVIDNPWLMTYKTAVIEAKLNALNVLGANNILLALPLLDVPMKRLKEITTWSLTSVVPNQKTRIAYLSEKLQCDPADISYAVSVHRFVQTLPFDRIATIIDILLEAGVPPENVLRDLWVIRYKKEQVLERVKRAKENGVEQFKPWMVRCTEKTFSNTLRIHSEKRTLLGPHNDSTVNYVSSRLGCTTAEARMMLSRHPQLRGIGAAKLCNTLDFLLGKEPEDHGENDASSGDKDLSAKFDRLQVWSSSRALCHSLETMRARLARLRALGYEPWNPAILYKSKIKFEEFVKKLEDKQNVSEADSCLKTVDPRSNDKTSDRMDVNR